MASAGSSRPDFGRRSAETNASATPRGMIRFAVGDSASKPAPSSLAVNRYRDDRACSQAALIVTIRRMRVLYHLWLSPFSRKVRIVLREKNLDFTLKTEKTWERRPEFRAQRPAGGVPVLFDRDGAVRDETAAIIEY